MIDASKLRAIVNSSREDFKSLAAIAGGDPATFYRGANFNDTDLRGEDLRGFNLEGATFRRARIDRNTLVDEDFSIIAGTERVVTVRMPLGNLIQGVLNSVDIKILRPTIKLYGDLIEEAVFSDISKTYISKNNVFLIPFNRDAFSSLIKKDFSEEMTRQYYKSKPVMNAAKHTMMVSSNSFIYSHFQRYLFENVDSDLEIRTIRQAALTLRTAKAVLTMSRKEGIGIQDLCCILLIAYASALKLRI